MIRRKRSIAVRVCAAALVLLFVGLALAAQGDENDPLITLSYLTDVFTPRVEQQVAGAVAGERDKLASRLDETGAKYLEEIDARLQSADGGVSFVTVTLAAGQTLSGKAGIEVVLRSGGAAAAGGLTDVTAGVAVSSGTALAESHLYVSSAAGAVLVTAAEASVMVRGDYTVE